MKIMFKLMNSEAEWAKFIKAKYQNRNGEWSTSWKLSSIWPGLKWSWNALKDDLRWVTEQDGSSSWKWTVSKDGSFSTAQAAEKIRIHYPMLVWPKYVWNKDLHPNLSANIWKIQQSVYIDDQVLQNRGFKMASRCCVCKQKQDSMQHLLWGCAFSVQIWCWICNIFNFRLPASFTDIISFTIQKRKLVKSLWLIAAYTIVRELWFLKNRIIFEDKQESEEQFKNKIIKLIRDFSIRLKSTVHTNNYELEILKYFGIS